MIHVMQDGADFYNAATGTKMYTSRFKVRDGNIADAEKARAAFHDWMLSEHPSQGFTWAEADHGLCENGEKVVGHMDITPSPTMRTAVVTGADLPDELSSVLYDAAQALGLVKQNNPEAMKWLNPELERRVYKAALCVTKKHGWFITVTEDHHFPVGSPDRWRASAKSWNTELGMSKEVGIVRGRTELEARMGVQVAITLAGG